MHSSCSQWISFLSLLQQQTVSILGTFEIVCYISCFNSLSDESSECCFFHRYPKIPYTLNSY